eukprot:PhF_6_TR17368/c0_g1_i2/m.26593
MNQLFVVFVVGITLVFADYSPEEPKEQDYSEHSREFAGGVQQFNHAVVQGKRISVIKFYSPMCGTCKELAPAWNEFVKNFNKHIEIYSINIDNDNGRAIADSLGAMEDGIPCVKVFSREGDKK